jgi:hypothetical protein
MQPCYHLPGQTAAAYIPTKAANMQQNILVIVAINIVGILNPS